MRTSTLDMSKKAIRARKEGLIAQGAKPCGGWTTRMATAQGSRFVGDPDHPATSIEATVVIREESDLHCDGFVHVNMEIVRGTPDENESYSVERRNLDRSEGLIGKDELEVVAVALMEAIRLAKEQGIVT